MLLHLFKWQRIIQGFFMIVKADALGGRQRTVIRHQPYDT